VKGPKEEDSEELEIVSKFEKLDFNKLWKGRDKVDLLEKNIVSVFLKEMDSRRVLEIGPGNGRLSGIIQNYSDEYVATDINKSFLREVKKKFHKEKSLHVSSNLFHLPFGSNSFSSIVVVRVFNFVSKPSEVLDEFSRVLVTGGHLLISISPKPSLATLIDDLKYRGSFSGKRGSRAKSVTFSTKNVAQVHPASYPTFSFKRSYVKRLFVASGFKEIARISSGLEDYSLLGYLPTRSLLNAGVIFRYIPIFPSTFYLLKKGGNGSLQLLDYSEILHCPSCGGKLNVNAIPDNLNCLNCGFVGTVDDGIIDLTFLPNDAKIVEEDPQG